MLLCAALAFAGPTKVVQGKLEKIDGTAWAIRVGTEVIPLSMTPETKWWAKKAAATEAAFHAGDAVHARIATDASPAVVRELADVDSWKWLETIRKGVREGKLKSFDGKRVVLSLTDGSEMSYRATEKTKVTLSGKTATLGDLRPGMKLWGRGRMLPNLDTWLMWLTDSPVTTEAKATKKADPKPAAGKKLPASGELTGDVDLVVPSQSLFDLVVGEDRFHISYTSTTAFFMDGVKVTVKEVQKGRSAKVTYRRDTFGRLMAGRVEIAK